MVEALLQEPLYRASMPTPMGFLERVLRPNEPEFDSLESSRFSENFYDHTNIPNSITFELSNNSGTERGDRPQSMNCDASGDIPESSMASHTTKPGFNRRRSRSYGGDNPHTSSGSRSSQSSSGRDHSISLPPTTPSENNNDRPLPGSQGPSLSYSLTAVPYEQRGGYAGHYTVATQPTPMNMGSSPPPYPFSHTYHQLAANNSMVSQGIQLNYPPILQPLGPVFPYQGHSPDGGSSPHPSFPGPRSPPAYPTQQVNARTPPTPTHHPPSSSQSGALSPSYGGSGQYHSLRYPSPMPTQYGYPARSFPTSPMFPHQYGPPPFGQHYTSPAEAEPQGAWYFVPHGPVQSSQQFDRNPSYQEHHPMPYSRLGHPEVDGAFVEGSSSANISPSIPLSPAHQFSQYSERRAVPIAESSHPSEGTRGQNYPSSAPSSTGRPTITGKQLVRRAYHPNPPSSRSEWVMWAGNVPADATHDELWRFFTEIGPSESSGSSGVLSIFLISRSSCAFVNYQTKTDLHEAINRFNGVPLRENDPRCARLVCRVRRKDDDLKAGVGAQRGMGMHTRWVKEQREKNRESSSDPSDASASEGPSNSPSSISERLAATIANVSLSGDEGTWRPLHGKKSSGSGSYASTNSSFLARHFPKRYFILKSLTQHDLDLSVERRVWATQKHNEGILDQAFRTSKEVYLIFGVNKSGEFYGYARMTGPVQHGERRVSWESRPAGSPTSSRSSRSPTSTRPSSLNAGQLFFSPSDHRLVDSSPLAVGSLKGSQPHLLDRPRTQAPPDRLHKSAPAMMGDPYSLPTIPSPRAKWSLVTHLRSSSERREVSKSEEQFELDPSAPLRAVRRNQGASPDGFGPSVPSLQPVDEDVERGDGDGEGEAHEGGGGRPKDSWGECFAIEWISTERLPFQRVRHLRNPWNHDREVKVSRDGTELEPSVGQKLLDEWGRLSEPVLATPAVAGKPTGPSKRAPKAMSGGLMDGVLEGKEGMRGRPSRT